jgi:hypothetical protein
MGRRALNHREWAVFGRVSKVDRAGPFLPLSVL